MKQGETIGGIADRYQTTAAVLRDWIAAAAGAVIVAGDDSSTNYGLHDHFYGNLVILRHDLPEVAQPLYTLYGHLSEVMVQVGQIVRMGQAIGKVGMSGVATGRLLRVS